MIFTIVLERPGAAAPFALRYELAENAAAAKWARLVSGAAFWGLGKGRPASARFYPREEAGALEPLAAELNRCLAAAAGAGAPCGDPDLAPGTLDQARLNRLHDAFQRHAEAGAPPAAAAALARLNALVHECETALRNAGRAARQNSLVVSLRFARSAPLEDADYEAFTVSRRFGDLFMAYGTLGKSLPHCFNDDDIELVRRGGVRPQLRASAELLAAFPSEDTPPGYDARYRERYEAWCERRGVRALGYDPAHPRHRPGCALVGRLHAAMDPAEVRAVVAERPRVSCVLLGD
jgi:hypothetical protein